MDEMKREACDGCGRMIPVGFGKVCAGCMNRVADQSGAAPREVIGWRNGRAKKTATQSLVEVPKVEVVDGHLCRVKYGRESVRVTIDGSDGRVWEASSALGVYAAGRKAIEMMKAAVA